MQYIINVINIILLIGIIQGLIFTVFMLKNKTTSKAIVYLSLIVLFLSLNNLQAWLVEKNYIKINYYIDYLHITWSIFLAPMFYLFLTNYLRIEQRLKKIFQITIIFFLLSVVFRIISLRHIKPQFNSVQFYSFLRQHNIYEDVFVFLYTLLIFLFCVYIFFKQRNKFKYVLSYDNLKWIKSFYKLSSLILFLWLIAICLNYYYTAIETTYFYSPLRLGTSFLIYWLGYQGFNQNRLMQSRISLRKEINESEDEFIDIKTDNEINFEELKAFNEYEKSLLKRSLFLDYNLSLTSLSKELATNSTNLSKLINNYSSYNFTDYINNFRVNYAKGLLKNEKYKTYTIWTIGLESGFNSKSTFYTAFKKFTNQTPTQFRTDFTKFKN